MKKLILILLPPLIFSCGGNSTENPDSGNILEGLAFTVDTVVVDSGEDIFILSSGLGAKALNQDKSILMFFEREPLNFVEVDLNNLKLIRKTPFQREGPNGVGPYGPGFQLGPKNELFIHNYNSQAIFNTKGELTKNLKIVPEGIDSELANDFQKLYSSAVFDFKKNRIYSQPTNEISKTYELFIIDPLTKKVRIEPIPEMKSVEDVSGIYITKSNDQSMYQFFGVQSFYGIENGHLLLGAGGMSGIYHLDPETDSLEFIDIQHKRFPNRMEISLNNPPANEEQFLENRLKVNAELNYLEPLWDENREMYLRFGKKTYLGQKQSDPSTYEVFLFAYDEGFRVLGETKIEGLDQVPANYFWKDGKLWSYVNVEDELGFAVIDFNF